MRDIVGATERQAERGLAILFVMLRGGVLIQMTIGAYSGWAVTHSPLYLGAVFITFTYSVGLIVNAVAQQAVHSLPYAFLDVLIGILGLAACVLTLPPEIAWNSWQNWAPGYLASAGALLGAVSLSPVIPAVVSLFMSAIYVAAGSMIVADSPATLFGNALNYPIFSMAAWALMLFVRRMTSLADGWAARAEEAVREMELNRYRMTVHDATGILRLLGDESTPQHVREQLRVQAINEAHRLRNFMEQHFPGGPDDESASLAEIVARASEGFGDLPLNISTALGTETVLAGELRYALQYAIATLLHNVRTHAEATAVYLHADEWDGRWEVVVRDDGVGFDPQEVPLGIGLREQVIQGLEQVGAEVVIDSVPGEGTAVTITGRTGDASGSPAAEEDRNHAEATRDRPYVGDGEHEHSTNSGGGHR